MEVKATYGICGHCEHVKAFKERGGITKIFCQVERKTAKDKGCQVGVLKETSFRQPPRFSNRGDWTIPKSCPYHTEQMFLQYDRMEGLKDDGVE